MQQLPLKIVPLAQLIVAVLAMYLLSEHFPILSFYLSDNKIFCIALIASGLLMMLIGVVTFHYHQTTVDPRKPDAASALVVAGIYRYSRNPMYLGMTLVLVGIAFILANVGSLLVIPFFIFSITSLQIKPEELALEERFGDTYRDYKERVNRWI